jgi:transcriptional regulator with XRE-family HTH domain
MVLGKLVAKNIRALRIGSGMSQKTLSEKTKLTIRYISRLENSAPNITLDVFERLANGLNCTPSDILNGGSKKPYGRHLIILDEIIKSLQILRVLLKRG